MRDIPRLKAEFFKTLGHPVRIRILELLSQRGELTVTALVQAVDVEQPYLSQQLAVLRRAGIVTARREGSTVFYVLGDPRIADLLAVAKTVLLDMVTATRDELERTE